VYNSADQSNGVNQKDINWVIEILPKIIQTFLMDFEPASMIFEPVATLPVNASFATSE